MGYDREIEDVHMYERMVDERVNERMNERMEGRRKRVMIGMGMVGRWV